MSKKNILVLLLVLATAAGSFYLFQYKQDELEVERFGQPGKIYKVGIVVRGESYRPGVEGFRSRMKKLGYEDGKNIIYYERFVDKVEDLKPVFVGLLNNKNVDLLFVYSTPATIEAYRQTKTVPIVFGSMGDPLASKTIQSLERSGTNVTGVSSLSAPLVSKRLEFLREAVPSIKKVAFPFTPEDIPGKSSYSYVLETARKLNIEIVPYYISKERSPQETAGVILRRDVDGMVISSDSAVWANLATYVEQTLKEKIPFAVFDKDMVVKGGLLGYGPDYFVSGEQSAVLVDKILNGQKPTGLPIEVPRKLVLVVNLKTAKAIGLTLPDSFLRKADIILGE